MSFVSDSGQWLSLVEYSARKGVSLSTLRRHIKANKIEYRLVQGKYLVLDQSSPGGEESFSVSSDNSEEAHSLKVKLESLETDLKQAQEEIAELKMLIALYEEKLPQKFNS